VARAGIGFDSEENEVVIVGRTGERHVARASKQVIAAEILDDVETLLESR
jgi:phosphopantothenoylcysteine synthetase/decarboxylase